MKKPPVPEKEQGVFFYCIFDVIFIGEHSPFVLIFNMQRSGNFLSMVMKLFHAA